MKTKTGGNMKNITKALIIALVFSCAGISCIDGDGGDTDPAEIAALKFEAAKKDLAIPEETDSDLDLPLVLNGVAISWVSSDEDVISNAGLVTRQPYDVQVTLTATLTLGSTVDTKEFIVTVTGHTVFEEVDAELVELYFQYSHPGANLRHWIVMIYSDENVVFHCTVDNGFFSRITSSLPNERFSKNVRVLSGENIYWEDHEVGEDGKYMNVEIVDAFIEIVLKLEETIIGYVVIKTYEGYPYYFDYFFHANVLKSVLFPQVDGEYQNVSEEYVKTAIQKIKDKNKGDSV